MRAKAQDTLMKKKLISFFLALVMTLSLASPIAALDITKALDAANTLYALGLFNGTGKDIYGNPTFDINRAATREEAITMLVRLLGKEAEALEGTWDMPFTDVSDWAKPYVGYAYANGLTSGISADTFGASDKVTAAQYITFVLRALGYSSETDFTWSSPWYFAYYIGLCDHGEYREKNNDSFKRGDVAIVSLNALGKAHKVTGESIIDRIYTDLLASEESTVDYFELAKQICSERSSMFSESVDYSTIKQYAVKDSSISRLFTEAELKQLRSPKSTKSVITYKEAVEDVEVYFDSFEYAYGAYYYFGESLFNSIKKNVLTELKGKETVTSTELDGILRKHMAVIKDCHLRRGEHDKYEYYYCEDQHFYKEGYNYYKLINGVKWYYEGCNNKYVTMEPHLTESGALVYSPTWFYLDAQAVDSSIITLKSGRQTKTETVNWIHNKSYMESSPGVDHKLLVKNGVAYISVRSFSGAQSEYTAFLNSARKVLGADAIIFDMRTCAGGSDYYGRQWVKNFTGQTPSKRTRVVVRETALTGATALGSENIYYSYSQGKMIENTTPIIVLTDDLCSSAAEFTIQTLKTMDNTIVIGGPSRGCSVCCGSLPTMYLPNSGVSYTFGTTMFWFDNEENTDDIGIKPDIWCNPSTALNAALMLLVREGVMNADVAWEITEGLN